LRSDRIDRRPRDEDIVVADTQPGVGTRFRATIGTGPQDGVQRIETPEWAIERQDKAATPSADRPLAC
jgi:hypothetical protein